MREREAQAQLRGERAAVVGGAEQPYLRRGWPRRHGLHFREWMVDRQLVIKVRDEVLDLLGKLLSAVIPPRPSPTP